MSETEILQHRDWWPENPCYGCGPRNPRGIRLESRVDDEGVTHAVWVAQDHHQGPPGVVNGGVVAVPMDCHGTWTAAAALRARATAEGRDPSGIATVTASYSVTLARPTPVGVPLTLRGELDRLDGRRAYVSVTTSHDGTVTATLDGVFVEVPMPPRES